MFQYIHIARSFREEIWDYDDNGHLIKVIHDPGNSWEEYLYDSTGRVSEICQYDNGSVGFRETFERNERGDKIKTVSYMGDSITSQCTIEYDEHGNRIGDYHYSGDENQLLQTVNYSYDDNGNRVKSQSSYTSDNNVSEEVYEYDGEGRLITAHSFSNGIEFLRWEYVYEEPQHMTTYSGGNELGVESDIIIYPGNLYELLDW